MKYTVISTLIAVIGIQFAGASTTITAYNAAAGDTGRVTQVVDNTGAPVTGNPVLIGNFASPEGLGTVAGSIDLAAYGWVEFASTTVNGPGIASGVFGAFGGTGAAGDLPTTETGLVGSTIWAVIGDGSGDYVIWASNDKFAKEDPVLGGAAVSFHTDDTTLVRGQPVVGGNTGLGGPLASFNGGDAVTFGIIPEPSVSLLGALAGLGMLIRRKR